jgi:tetratricopeptide (TPR) repeat protein
MAMRTARALVLALCVAAPAAARDDDAGAALGRATEALKANQLGRASAEFERAREIADAGGDAATGGEALKGLGLVAWYGGRFADADRAYRGARPLLVEGGRLESVALVDLGLGLVAVRLGELSAAVGRFKRGIRGARRVGDTPLEMRGLRYLARAYDQRADLARAAACWRKRLEVARALRDHAAAAATWESLGVLETRRGRPAAALAALDQALTEAEVAGDRPLEVIVRNDRGAVYADGGDRRRARSEWLAARRLAAASEAPLGRVQALENLSTLVRAEGRFEKADRTTENARAIAARSRLRGDVHDG